MEKTTKVNHTKFVRRVHGDKAVLTAAELIPEIEKVRPVIDEDGEWYCAEELFARTNLSKDDIVKMMSYEPIGGSHLSPLPCKIQPCRFVYLRLA